MCTATVLPFPSDRVGCSGCRGVIIERAVAVVPGVITFRFISQTDLLVYILKLLKSPRALRPTDSFGKIPCFLWLSPPISSCKVKVFPSSDHATQCGRRTNSATGSRFAKGHGGSMRRSSLDGELLLALQERPPRPFQKKGDPLCNDYSGSIAVSPVHIQRWRGVFAAPT